MPHRRSDHAARRPGMSAEERRRLKWLVGSAVGLILVWAGVWYANHRLMQQRMVLDAREAAERGDFPSAWQLIGPALSQSDPPADVLLVAGVAALGLKRPQEALQYWEQIPDDGSEEAVQARIESGKCLFMVTRRLTDAERMLQRAVKQDPRRSEVHDYIAFILGLCGRSWELIPHRLAMIALDRVEPMHLYVLSLASAAIENPELLEPYARSAPDDPGPLLGLSRLAYEDRNYEQAAEYARAAVERDPSSGEAYAKQGRALFQLQSASELRGWLATVPAAADSHPEIWALRGSVALRLHEEDVALRCYWEAARRDANHQAAIYQVGRLLANAGRNAEAAPFLTRANGLQEYINAVKIAMNMVTAEEVRHAAELAERLGLVWESYGWLQLLGRKNALTETDQVAMQRLRSRFATTFPPVRRNLEEVNPALAIDLSDLPLARPPQVAAADSNSAPSSVVTASSPAGTSTTGSASPSVHERPSTALAGSAVASQPASTANAVVTNGRRPSLMKTESATSGGLQVTPKLVDQAAERGLVFQYFNAGNPQRDIRYMYEFTGGGLGVLDHDLDGWPDIYCTQGCAWPPEKETGEHLDQLFQNRDGNRFVNVTNAAHLQETGFGQGVAVADYDDDGFPDLWVANIGANRLLHNQGDGTFAVVELPADIAGNEWTSSMLMADVNRDGWCDLLAVNYLGGDDVFTLRCGLTGVCLPQKFPGVPDRLSLGTGEGRFVDASQSAGVALESGKGLGVVAADFMGDGSLDIFVANDSVANFFYRLSEPAPNTRFREEAFIAGVAMNEEGKAEACMGVACGDADGDGRLDLYVTNFYLESNTFYRQEEGGTFSDSTQSAGLRDPSLPMLGFGTQFFDLENDGWLDLFVANGHIGDFRAEKIPFQMSPQLYRNLGQGQFTDQSATAGSFFTRPCLGRAVAVTDWNRDGADDLLVGHLDQPLALLTNQTPHGRFLRLQVRGTTAPRDAVGAIVKVTSGERRWVRQITAGDGYQSTNSRCLLFGLGEVKQVDQITVQWPSGHEESFGPRPVDSHWLLIEGGRSFSLQSSPTAN
jgi:tetratricopeptide (TPR) repeat protein